MPPEGGGADETLSGLDDGAAGAGDDGAGVGAVIGSDICVIWF